MPQYVFTSFIKEHRHLSNELWRRALPLMSHIESASAPDQLQAFSADTINQTISELGIEPPQLLRTLRGEEREGRTAWDASRSVGSPTRRFYIAVEVSGDITLVGYWPDLSGPNLTPVDWDVEADNAALNEVSLTSHEHLRNWVESGELWEITSHKKPWDKQQKRPALRTYFDLTPDEEDLVARAKLDLPEKVRARLEAIAPIVNAVNAQTQQFLTEDLPACLLERAAAKTRMLSNRQAVRDSLSFPYEWQGREPELVESQIEEPLRHAELSDAVPEQADEHSETVGGMDLDTRSRLSTATFHDVLFTLRHWANAVERTPSAFGALVEDRISDLLAATWNATLPGAAREVYTRGGKSDIFIQADALDPGRGPAKVFICEAKWATGHDVIRRALDPQLFGYLNVHDTSAVLLILMEQKNFPEACNTYLKVLESIEGHRHTVEDAPVAGWPLLEFAREGHKVTVCAAFIHIPRRTASDK